MHTPVSDLVIEGSRVGPSHPTYFVADIAANHDGDIERAVALVHLAALAGANAAKFQHFHADTIVSDFGFRALGSQQSHQSKWKKSVYEVYKAASVDLGWTPRLRKACQEAGITFFTSPYSLELVDEIDPYVPAYKIGSGDITWLDIVEKIARKNKPYLIASGASTMNDVERAIEAGLKHNPQIALLQCNTNYTASLENFRYVQLRVLETYAKRFPGMVLGLSDHTPGHATVLGAVALGARIVEKHFTDDTSREGPDHGFSMDPHTWREMVDRTRELENALGSGVKKVEENESDTVVIQRRCVRAAQALPEGTILQAKHLAVLRPAPSGSIPPSSQKSLIGHRLVRHLSQGEHLLWSDLE